MSVLFEFVWDRGQGRKATYGEGKYVASKEMFRAFVVQAELNIACAEMDSHEPRKVYD